MAVHVQGLDVIVLLVVPGKMHSLVKEWGAMESLDLLGKDNMRITSISQKYACPTCLLDRQLSNLACLEQLHVCP